MKVRKTRRRPSTFPPLVNRVKILTPSGFVTFPTSRPFYSKHGGSHCAFSGALIEHQARVVYVADFDNEQGAGPGVNGRLILSSFAEHACTNHAQAWKMLESEDADNFANLIPAGAAVLYFLNRKGEQTLVELKAGGKFYNCRSRSLVSLQQLVARTVRFSLAFRAQTAQGRLYL